MSFVIWATSSNCVIGDGDSLPWDCKEDLKWFKERTSYGTVIMGSNTWKSLGCKNLPNRKNIVISSNPSTVEGNPDIIVTDIQVALKLFNEPRYIIGGATLLNSYLKEFVPKQLFVSHIKKKCNGNVFFYNTFPYTIVDTVANDEFDILTYEHNFRAFNNESQYLSLLRKIRKQGYLQSNERTKVGTLSLFGEQIVFDLTEGFPLLTTKKMAWNMIQRELYFFLAGKTNTKEYNLDIWRAHTSKEFLAERNLNYEEGEMGPMYGYQWRNFNGQNIDQLERVIKEIKSDPESRRLLMTTYNPIQVDQGVLYPCHGLVLQFFCREDYIDAHMYQRSADAFLGLPYNIASYSLLLHLVAHAVGRKAGRLTISLGNVHIYNNHIEQVDKQLCRKPLAPPKLSVSGSSDIDWNNIDSKTVKLWGYFHYDAIKADIAI